MSRKIDDKDRIITWFKTASPIDVEVMLGKIEIIRQMRPEVRQPEQKKRAGRPAKASIAPVSDVLLKEETAHGA